MHPTDTDGTSNGESASKISERRRRVLQGAGVALAGASVMGTVSAQDDDSGDDTADVGGEEGVPLGFTVDPFAGELEIDLEVARELPPAALSTAQQAIEGGNLDSAQIDFDRVVPVYEIGGTDADGNEVEVDVQQDGVLEEIEIVIPENEAKAVIPTAVLDTFGEAFPDATVDARELSVRPAGNGLLRRFYEFDITAGDGDEFDVEINERGTQYTVEPASQTAPAFPSPD